MDLYVYFATYLELVHTFGEDKSWLSHGTVKVYLGCLLNMAKAEFHATGTAET